MRNFKCMTLFFFIASESLVVRISNNFLSSYLKLFRAPLALAFFIFFVQANGQAWGGVGHHAICQTATHLVKNEKLKDFLDSRQHVMGHVCNIPDIYWKSLNTSKTGNPTHYLNAETLDLSLKTMPTDRTALKKIAKEKEVDLNSEEMGSLWWRADQFFRRSLEEAKKIKLSQAPKKDDFQNDANPYNMAVYNMMVNMGLMGHFYGDVSMPYHNSSDHDGYSSGHGGIHSYYEEGMVSPYGLDLVVDILKQAKKLAYANQVRIVMNKKPYSAVEAMKWLSSFAIEEKNKIEKLDQVFEKSIEKTDSTAKKAAKRVAPNIAAKKFRLLIVEEMARSALTLAQAWDQIYEHAGKPDLSHYRSYKYPFTPEFVEPDYN